MTRRRMTVCSVSGCPQVTDQGRCDEHRREHERRRGTRQERGYDRRHERTRAKLLPRAYGQPCPWCGERMWPHDALDLDHTDDRKGYVGIVHAQCNRSRRPQP